MHLIINVVWIGVASLALASSGDELWRDALHQFDTGAFDKSVSLFGQWTESANREGGNPCAGITNQAAALIEAGRYPDALSRYHETLSYCTSPTQKWAILQTAKKIHHELAFPWPFSSDFQMLLWILSISITPQWLFSFSFWLFVFGLTVWSLRKTFTLSGALLTCAAIPLCLGLAIKFPEKKWGKLGLVQVPQATVLESNAPESTTPVVSLGLGQLILVTQEENDLLQIRSPVPGWIRKVQIRVN